MKVISPIKRALFTGDADEFLAVKSFNEKLIHRFIRKDASAMAEVLEKLIQELRMDYFSELSMWVFKSLSADPSWCLESPGFVDFFSRSVSRKKYCRILSSRQQR